MNPVATKYIYIPNLFRHIIHYADILLCICYHHPKEIAINIWDCYADSTPGLKLITVNKRKLNNKHTQRTQEFMWFGKLPTSMETMEKFHYKNKEIQ